MSVENLQGEVWRDIVIDSEVYPYRISSFGRIKSLNFNHTGREKLMKVTADKDGYFKVGLYNKTERRQKRFFVHRLLAIVYLENPLNLPCVNHKIEGEEGKSMNFVFFKSDGSVDVERTTIEWCDYKYNTNYKTAIDRKIETRKNSTAWKEGVIKTHAKLKKIVYQYTTDLQLVAIHPSVSEAGVVTNSSFKHISACCLKKRKSHNGFIWSYEPLTETKVS